MPYKLITGIFAGNIIEEGMPILDVAFNQLDIDIQERIRYWAEGELGSRYIAVNGGCDFAYRGGSGEPISMDQIKEDHEFSWRSEETEEDIDLLPASEW
jgi:hypothetical protein